MDTQLIISMYNNNVAINKICKILDLPEFQVYECLYENGFTHLEERYYKRNKALCDDYINGVFITKLAQKYNIDRHTVTDILRKNKVYKPGKDSSDIFSEEKIERTNRIIELYTGGLSCKQVGQQVGLTAGAIAKTLHKAGVDTRPQHSKGHSKGTTKNRKYLFDLSYFSTIDTEEKAYWLGFLYADGYVGYRGVITLALKESDKKHLEKFKASLKANDNPLKYNIKTKSYRVDICSIKTAEDLKNKGCFQNKSLRLKFPDNTQVPYELVNHFMRGYFDGDGCIYYSNGYAHINILGTKEFLDRYEDILLKETGIKTRNKRIHKEKWGNTEAFEYSGKKVKGIYNFLYRNATIYLDRKYEKFINRTRASQEKVTELRGL